MLFRVHARLAYPRRRVVGADYELRLPIFNIQEPIEAELDEVCKLWKCCRDFYEHVVVKKECLEWDELTYTSLQNTYLVIIHQQWLELAFIVKERVREFLKSVLRRRDVGEWADLAKRKGQGLQVVIVEPHLCHMLKRAHLARQLTYSVVPDVNHFDVLVVRCQEKRSIQGRQVWESHVQLL